MLFASMSQQSQLYVSSVARFSKLEACLSGVASKINDLLALNNVHAPSEHCNTHRKRVPPVIHRF